MALLTTFLVKVYMKFKTDILEGIFDFQKYA